MLKSLQQDVAMLKSRDATLAGNGNSGSQIALSVHNGASPNLASFAITAIDVLEETPDLITKLLKRLKIRYCLYAHIWIYDQTFRKEMSKEWDNVTKVEFKK
ncbi:hypothetical protein TorRG33x02_126590 [Trema orientale]|uniref:Uncharacterized protein n=1 Tax=Trema orientale TaxID=63057 RepID=A0A2P5F1F5_TREOI|nr:hypothetical protein TorRG33x02_126590 [Trema orientale]